MYAKVFPSMFDGTLVSKGPWQALVTFQQMLILCDKEGVVDMTADTMHRRTSIPLEIFTVGIPALEAPDPDSRSQLLEGRRIVRLDPARSWGWQIVNYEHYRGLRNAEERREYHRDYYHRVRKEVEKGGTQTAQPDSTVSTFSTETQQASIDSTDSTPHKHKQSQRKENVNSVASDFEDADSLDAKKTAISESEPDPTTEPASQSLPAGQPGAPRKRKSADDDLLTPAARILFDSVWKLWSPEHRGTKRTAERALAARLNEFKGDESDLLDLITVGTERYLSWLEATGTIPKNVGTFFGPDRHFETEWTLPQAQVRPGWERRTAPAENSAVPSSHLPIMGD